MNQWRGEANKLASIATINKCRSRCGIDSVDVFDTTDHRPIGARWRLGDGGRTGGLARCGGREAAPVSGTRTWAQSGCSRDQGAQQNGHSSGEDKEGGAARPGPPLAIYERRVRRVRRVSPMRTRALPSRLSQVRGPLADDVTPLRAMAKAVRAPLPFAAHLAAIGGLLARRPSSGPNLAFLLLLGALEELLIYHVGLLSAQFYYILLKRDAPRLYIQLVLSLCLILFMALVKSAKNYVSSVLYIEWREHMSKLLIDRYLKHLNYYSLNSSATGAAAATGTDAALGRASLDNVDQRISQDVDKLCAELSTVISQIVLSPFTVAYYSLQVYRTIGVLGLVGCVSLFVASTLVNRIFINSITKWAYLKGKHEGDYRTEHANVAKHCELIAFANAEAQQRTRTLALLRTLLSVHENLILSQFYLNVSTAIFDYSGSVLSFLIIAVPIFSGSFDHLNEAELSRTISSNAFFCLYLINCFSRLLDISSNFAQLNGFGYRITELLGALRTSSRCQSRTSASPSQDKSALYVRFSGVQLVPLFSGHQPMTRELSFEVWKGQNLYITGDSGLDKTNILRIVKGLWPISSGSIYCALDLDDVRQIMFVSNNSQFGHFFLEDILRDATLGQSFVCLLRDYTLEFVLDADTGSPKVGILQSISPGQRQILNFLIVFLYAPKLVFLDDATNSLSDQVVTRLYTQCAQLSITVVTIANNDALRQFHSHFISLN